MRNLIKHPHFIQTIQKELRLHARVNAFADCKRICPALRGQCWNKQWTDAERTNNLFVCDNHWYLIPLHCQLPINQWANELTSYENSHPVCVCIILLMLHQEPSWRYWMLFRRSADTIIKGHHKLAGRAVWRLQAKETDSLWRRRRKTIFKVNTVTKCSMWSHLLHLMKLQIASYTERTQWTQCMRHRHGSGAVVTIIIW